MPSRTVLVSAAFRSGGGVAFFAGLIDPVLATGLTRGCRVLLLSLPPLIRIVRLSDGHVIVVVIVVR